MSFEGLFHPRGVAIIGASADLTRIGGHPIKAHEERGLYGGIFLVNPKYQELHGLSATPTPGRLGSPAIWPSSPCPPRQLPHAVARLRRRRHRLSPLSSRQASARSGAEGRELEAELKRAVKESGVRIVGPNCQGMLSLQARVWAAFGSVADETDFRPGDVSCAFQSGGFGYAIVNLAEAQGLGFRYCVSSGNEADIDTPRAAFRLPRRRRHLGDFRLSRRHARCAPPARRRPQVARRPASR